MLPQLFKKAQALTEAVNESHGTQAEYTSSVAPYNNPFNREDIISVNIYYRKFWSTDKEFKASGSIDFKRGNTNGTQNFKASTIEEVLEDMAKFVKSL